MSQRLADSLREAADEVPAYDVLERAIAQGRRRKWRAAAASAAAVIAVLALVSALVAIPLARDTQVAEPPAGSTIPERIGPPGPFTRDASSSPPGLASLIFAPARGKLVAVGAADDTYRVLDTESRAGYDAFVSPTGDRVAVASGDGVAVVDLVKGGTQTYDPTPADVDVFAPLAWLPDGSALVTVATTYADDPATEGIVKRLSILDLTSGRVEQFAEATWPLATPGFAVAVSPDGTRIAYQFSNFITILDRATGAKKRLTVESYFALAGRAAWAPDGTLALIHRAVQSDGRTWDVVFVDPVTGDERSVLRAAMVDKTVIRLIGWSGDTPIVVGYDGPYSAFGSPGNVVFGGYDGTVGVYALTADGVRTLVYPDERVSYIDVAEGLLAEPRSRPGDPPWTFPPVTSAVAFYVLLLVVVGAFMAEILRRARLRDRAIQADEA